MASTREERLQMRQRGAGRKIKDVDFGFSFGAAAPGPSASAGLSLFPEPEKASQTRPAPKVATPPRANASSQVESHLTSFSQRTPRSARNNLPPRPSPYDLPSDDRPGEPRSNKRRRIENTAYTLSRNTADSQGSEPKTVPNGNTDTTEAPASHTAEVLTAPDASLIAAETLALQPQLLLFPYSQPNEQAQIEPLETNATVTETRAPALFGTEPQISEQDVASYTSPIPTAEVAASDNAPKSPSDENQATVESTVPPTRLRKSQSPRIAKATQSTKARMLKKDLRTSASPISLKVVKQKVNESRTKAKSQGGSVDSGARGDPESYQSTSGPSRTNKSRDVEERHPSKSHAVEESIAAEIERNELDTVQPEKASKPKSGRGRLSLAGKHTGTIEAESQKENQVNPADIIVESPAGPPRRGRKAKKAVGPEPGPESPQEPEAELQLDSAKAGRGRSKKKDKSSVTAHEPEPEPPIESNLPKSRGRSKKNKRAAVEEPEANAEAEVEVEVEPETQAGPVSKARGRSGKKSKSASTSESISRTEPVEEQPEGESNKETRSQRKPRDRQPRGETVPVTVHRLANASALSAIYNSAGSGDEGEESADEISTRQKTKLPNRGGVNPADVLGQICRETLEKTLTTLQDGIAKEANPTRRAEWTRKRKAVEAFGSELDSRLLDLSEMLDSNFMLGMQLKKSKRDMMDLRTHLFQVRRERENIALQMDAVRAKHMEEEKAKTARNTINHSLHSLELALDRRQNNAPLSANPSTTEIEFMLRSLADDVSSQAPGSQGGLLSQIRAFNAQLESTARRLES
ncbi:hypothetical protein N7495_008327 [Penicillium taxi]|uniref:uncharacterized protein n=1 Tax=Penicillium taxi TaxID=168475 RepID=UPI002545A3FC|nr:uncharacterized protein N7495_008327 [Penicillium taxi]KAJ5888286.1 hypothetical protein N7495_008327 [Penicillium taxi]